MSLLSRQSRWPLTAALVAAMTTGVVAAVPGPADAASPHSFAGSCTLHGTATFTPALTPVPAAATLANQSTGTCTGTLDGARIIAAPVTMSWQTSVYADGCLAARTTAPGPGTITFPGGVPIGFTAGFSGLLTEYPLTIHGQHSGTAHGLANLLTPGTSPLVALRCAGLSGGLRQTPADVLMTTDTPLVSDNGKSATG